MNKTKKCPECGIGYLIQLVCDNEDVCFCPICESVLHSTVAWIKVACKCCESCQLKEVCEGSVVGVGCSGHKPIKKKVVK